MIVKIGDTEWRLPFVVRTYETAYVSNGEVFHNEDYGVGSELNENIEDFMDLIIPYGVISAAEAEYIADSINIKESMSEKLKKIHEMRDQILQEYKSEGMLVINSLRLEIIDRVINILEENQ